MDSRVLRSIAALAVLAFAPAAYAGPPAVNVSHADGASTTPGSAIDAADRVHLAWADDRGDDSGGAQAVYYARSFDGGATFESPRPISGAVAPGTRPHEIRVVVTAAGQVAVAWWDNVVESDGRVFVTAFFTRSTDGGESFAPAVATSIRYRDDGAAKEGFRNTTSLTLAAGPGDVYGLLATVPDVFRGGNVYFAKTADGATFSDPVRVSSYTLAIPRAAANGLVYLPNGDAYAVWSESFGDFVNEIRDVYYATSSDGGRTFSPRTQIAHVRGVVGAAIRVGDAIALATQSLKNDHSLASLKVFRSTDGGRTYAGRRRVTRTGSYSHLNESSVAANASGVVAVAWAENSSRLGPDDGIYVAISRDGGRTFAAPELVTAGLFVDPPSVTVDSEGVVGIAYSSAAAALADREVLFVRVAR
jgi:hypothetical protein